MVNSVIGDFECAFGGFVTTEGLATDELQDATITAANWQLDRRDDGFTSGSYGTGGCTASEGVYTPMSTARYEADQAITRLNGWTDATGGRRAPAPAGRSRRVRRFLVRHDGHVDVPGRVRPRAGRRPEGHVRARREALHRRDRSCHSGKSVDDAECRVRGPRARASCSSTTCPARSPTRSSSRRVSSSTRRTTRRRRADSITSTTRSPLGGGVTVEVMTRNLTTENGDVDPRSATTLLAAVKSADGKSQIVIPNKFNAGRSPPARRFRSRSRVTKRPSSFSPKHRVAPRR